MNCGLGIADCGLIPRTVIRIEENPQSEIRDPQSRENCAKSI